MSFVRARDVLYCDFTRHSSEDNETVCSNGGLEFSGNRQRESGMFHLLGIFLLCVVLRFSLRVVSKHM